MPNSAVSVNRERRLNSGWGAIHLENISREFYLKGISFAHMLITNMVSRRRHVWEHLTATHAMILKGLWWIQLTATQSHISSYAEWTMYLQDREQEGFSSRDDSISNQFTNHERGDQFAVMMAGLLHVVNQATQWGSACNMYKRGHLSCHT